MARYLVLASGGLDSTACIYKLLTETDHELHLHHIRMINSERRWALEDQAIARTVDWFRTNLRPDLELTISTFDVLSVGRATFDMMVVYFTAAQVLCQTRFIDVEALVLGNIQDDYQPNEISLIRLPYALAVYDNGFKEQGRAPIPVLRPFEKMNKRQVFDILPPELIELTWSCRHPKPEGDRLVACGFCHVCGQYEKWGVVHPTAPTNHEIVASMKVPNTLQRIEDWYDSRGSDNGGRPESN